MAAFKPIRDRILDSILIDENGCWIWQLAKYHTGYGAMRVKRRTVSAHRVSYEEFVGPIPADKVLDHLCRVVACVNPDHLEPVPIGENNRRGLRGYELTGHCRSGRHRVRGPEDVYINKTSGTPTCKECAKERQVRLRRRRREERQRNI